MLPVGLNEHEQFRYPYHPATDGDDERDTMVPYDDRILVPSVAGNGAAEHRHATAVPTRRLQGAMSRPDETDRLNRAWWKEAVVYQVYPRSFNDSDGDGIGDIRGIIEKIDYLDSLGVDVVWLSPVYDSPNGDNGYDIRDYRAIAPEFGDMADWETLLTELHARDMRLVMDLVVNHTSDEHEWFQRSRRRENEYEDYYYWRDGTPENPPNNWTSIFGGPAWTYDDKRRQWYLHLFDEKQPDLNWRNPDVRVEIKEMMVWWLEKGINGFRMDAISYLSKADGLPDGDPDRSPIGVEWFSHGPRIDDYFEELYEDVLSNYDAMAVGEMGDTTIEQAADYLDADNGLDMIFQFDHVNLDAGLHGAWDPERMGKWDLRELKQAMTHKQEVLNERGWDALFFGNHDLSRSVSRFGDERYHRESATLIATLLLTMRGTPYIYQGEEIGMTNTDFENLDAVDDPATIGAVEELLAEGSIDSYEAVRDLVNYRSRDHSRTPMQWNKSENAGFTRDEPWLETNPNYPRVNVEAALADEDSIWHHYRTLIALRHEEDVLVYGKYDLLLPDDERIYAYTRTLGNETVLVVLNWSDESVTVADDDDIETADAAVLYGNYDDAPTDPGGREFRPYEAVVYRL